MKSFFRTDRIWFKAVAIIVTCLFLFNEHAFALEEGGKNVSLNTLSPVSRFKPVVHIEKNGDDFVIQEDLTEKSQLLEQSREDMGFVYLNLLISQVLERYEEEISAQGLKRLIEKHLSHVDFTRFMWRDIYKEGNAFCLPYSPKDGEGTQVIRYFLPSASSAVSSTAGSVPAGVGNVRLRPEYFRQSEEAVRILMTLASLGHSSNKRTNMRGSLSNLLQYSQFVLKIPLEEERLKPYEEDVEGILAGIYECANLFSSLNSKAQQAIAEKREKKKPFNESQALKWRDSFSEGLALFKKTRSAYFSIKDEIKEDLLENERTMLAVFEKHLRFLEPLFEDRASLMNGKVSGETISLNDLLDNIFEFLETAPYDQALGTGEYINRININLPEEEVFIEGNEISLASLFCDLIDDSIRYAIAFDKEKAETTINVKLKDGSVLVDIRDNGIGIEENELAKLSDPFYTTEGSGIGLTEARIIAEDHKGELKIESRPIGKHPKAHGTTFKLSFPIADDDGKEDFGGAYLKLPTPRGHIKNLGRKLRRIINTYCKPEEFTEEYIVPEDSLSWRSVNAHLRENNLPVFDKEERPVVHVFSVEDFRGNELLGFPLRKRPKFSDLIPVVSYISEADGKLHVFMTSEFFDDYLNISHLQSSRSKKRLQSLRLAEILDHERYEASREGNKMPRDVRHHASAMRARYFLDKDDEISCFHKWALDCFALTEDGREHIKMLLDEYRFEPDETDERIYEKAFYEYAKGVLPREQFSASVQRQAHHLLNTYMHGDTNAFKELCKEVGLSARELSRKIEEEEKRHVLNAIEGFKADKEITYTHETDVEIDHSKKIVRKTPKEQATERNKEQLLESYRIAQDRLGGLIADFTIIDGRIYQEKVRPLSDYYIDLAESKGEFTWMKDAPVSVKNAMAKDIMRKHLDCVVEIARRGMVLMDAKPANMGINENGDVVLLDLGASTFMEGKDGIDIPMQVWLSMNTYRLKNIVNLSEGHNGEFKYDITDAETVDFFGKEWAKIWIEVTSGRIVADDEEIEWNVFEDGKLIINKAKNVFPETQQDAEEEYRRITFIPTKFAKDEILNLIMHSLEDQEKNFLPGFSRLWQGPSSGAPRGSISGIFEFLCDMGITSEEKALTEEEIAASVGRALHTIDPDIRGLYFHLHLIRAANPGAGKDRRRYYVPDDVAAKRKAIQAVLKRFQKGKTMLRPNYDILDWTYETALKGILENDQMTQKGLLSKIFFPWELSLCKEEIREKYGDPKIRMLYYISHYTVWTIGILPYIIIISSAALARAAGVSEFLKSGLSGPFTGMLYEIGMDLSDFAEVIVSGTLSGDLVLASLAVTAITIPILLFSISHAEHRKLRKALKEEGAVYSSGAYRFSRHPQYFLSLSAAAVLPVICPTPGMLGVFVLLLISMNIAVLLEEVIVWMDAGDAYLKYREETPSRVIPAERGYYVLYLMTEMVNIAEKAIDIFKRALWAVSPFAQEEEVYEDESSEMTESAGRREDSTSGIKKVVMDGKVVSFQDFTKRIQTASTMGCIFNAEIDGETLRIGFRPRIIENQQQYHHFIKAPKLVNEKTFRAIINGGGEAMDVGILLPRYAEDKSAELRDAYITLGRVLTEYGFPASFGIYRRKGEEKDHQLFSNPPVTFKDLAGRRLSSEDERIVSGIKERTAALSKESEPEGSLYRENIVTIKGDDYGVHARPAFEISKILRAFKEQLGVEVYIEREDAPGKECNAESYNDLVGMALENGEKVRLKIYISERDNFWGEDTIKAVVMMAESVFRNVVFVQQDRGSELYLAQLEEIKSRLKKVSGDEAVKRKRRSKILTAAIALAAVAGAIILNLDDVLSFLQWLWDMIMPVQEISASEPQQAALGGGGILAILAGLEKMVEEKQEPSESAPYTVYKVMREQLSGIWSTPKSVYTHIAQDDLEKELTLQDVEKTMDLLVALDLAEGREKSGRYEYKVTGLSPPEWEKVEPFLKSLEGDEEDITENEFAALKAGCLRESKTEDVWNIETICGYNSAGRGSSGQEEWGIFNSTPTLWALEIIHYIKMIDPDARIADLGSGDGKFCFLAARHFRSVTGIEARTALHSISKQSQRELLEANPAVRGAGNVLLQNADFLDEATDLSSYDALYYFFTSPSDMPLEEYNKILMEKLTGANGMKPGARFFVLGTSPLEYDKEKIEDESVNIMGMHLGVYKRKDDQKSSPFEEGTIRVLSLSGDKPEMRTLQVVNAMDLSSREKDMAARGMIEWLKWKEPQAVHLADISTYAAVLEYGLDEELEDLYFAIDQEQGTLEGWLDLSFRKTLSALEVAPWNREPAQGERRYKGIGSELRAFAINKLKERYGDALYEDHLGKVIALGHKEAGFSDEFDGAYVDKDIIETFLSQQKNKREELDKKYSDDPPVHTYSDLISEGYEIEETDVVNGAIKVPEVKVKIFRRSPEGTTEDMLSNISFKVIDQMRTIVIDNFYPRFPEPANGRGKALFRYLFNRPEYSGYHIIAYALEPLQRSFIKMEEFQPMADVEQGQPPVSERIGKEMMNEMDTFYGEAQFLDNPELFEVLKEDWETATIYGVVPNVREAEIIPLDEVLPGGLAAGYPYEIFQVLRRYPNGLTEREIRPLTRGNMPDGHLSEETIKRDFAILRKLGIVYRELDKYKAAELAPEEWETIKEVLEGMGKRPSSSVSDLARDIIRTERLAYIMSNMPEGTYLTAGGARQAALHLNKKDMEGLFTEKNVQAIERAIGENRPRQTNKRAIYVNLPDAVTVGGRRWTKIYIKGVVFDEKHMLPPHAGDGYARESFSATGTTLNKEKPVPSPDGAMVYENARNEFLQHRRIYSNESLKENNIFGAGPVGYGAFGDAKYYKGQLLGFVLLGVDDEMPERGQEIHPDEIARWASTLRKLHNSGFHHPFFHRGNISWREDKVYVHDLDHMSYIEPVKANFEELLSLQFRDLYLWYHKNMWKFYMKKEDGIIGEQLQKLGDDIRAQVGDLYWGKFVQGYFYGANPIFHEPLSVGLARIFYEIELDWKAKRDNSDYKRKGGSSGNHALTMLKTYIAKNIEMREKREAGVDATGDADKNAGPGSNDKSFQRGVTAGNRDPVETFPELIVKFFGGKSSLRGVDLGAGNGAKTETVYDILRPHFDNVNFTGLEIDKELIPISEQRNIRVMSFDVEEPLDARAAGTQDLVTLLSPPADKIGKFIDAAKKLVSYNGLVVVSLRAKDMDELLRPGQSPSGEAAKALEDFSIIELSGENDPIAKVQKNNKFFIYSPAGVNDLISETFTLHRYTKDRLYMEPGVFDNEKLSYRIIDNFISKEISLKDKKVWDLGTGSGIMGIYAARQGAKVVATDIKASSFRSAKRNAESAGLSSVISVRKGSLSDPLSEDETFDYILCDPPIFSTKRYSDDPNVYDEDFNFVKRILYEATLRLNTGGQLFMVYPASRAVDEAREGGIIEFFDLREERRSLEAKGLKLHEEKIGGFFSVWVVTREDEVGANSREKTLFEMQLPPSAKSDDISPEISEAVGLIDDFTNTNSELLGRHEVLIDDLASEMAMNAMEHGQGGIIKLTGLYDAEGALAKLRIVVEDKGPGIKDPNEIVGKNLRERPNSGRGCGLLRVTFDPTIVVIESRGSRWVRKTKTEAASSWFELEGSSAFDDGMRITAEFDTQEEVPLKKMGMTLKSSEIDGERYSLDVIGGGNRLIAFMYAQKGEDMLLDRWDQIGIRGINADPKYRGRGIAKQLFRSFLREYPEIDILHAEVRNPALILMAEEHFSFTPVDAKEENAVYVIKEDGERYLWIPNRELRFEYEFGSLETMNNEFIVLKKAPEKLDAASKIYFNTVYMRPKESVNASGEAEKGTGPGAKETRKIGPETEETEFWPIEGGEHTHNPYAIEDNISRGLADLDRVYHGELTGLIMKKRRKDPYGPKIRVLMIGVGRGFEALDLMKVHEGDVEVTVTSKEDLMLRSAEDFEDMSKERVYGYYEEEWLEEALKYLRTRHIKCDLDEGIQLKDDYFDVVVIDEFSLGYVSRKMYAITEMLRVCREGGTVFCSPQEMYVRRGDKEMEFPEYVHKEGLEGFRNLAAPYGPELMINKIPELDMPRLGAAVEKSYKTRTKLGKEITVPVYETVYSAPEAEDNKEKLANSGKNDNNIVEPENKKELMSLKDVSYTELGLEEVDAIIADFDGVDRDQSKEVSDETISLKRALSARGIHNITITGLDLAGFFRRFGGINKAARISNGEEYVVLTCTGAVGHKINKEVTVAELDSFETTQLGSERDRLELRGLLMDSMYEVLAENNVNQMLGSQIDTWAKEQQITLDTRPFPEVNALRYKIAARLKEKLFGIDKFENIAVVCSGGAIDIAALTKAESAVKMIKALRLKKVVIAGDSAGTEDEPGNDRSLFKLTQQDLESAGIDWDVEILKVYVGKEEVYDLPKEVLVAEEEAKETQPMIDIYTAILQAKAAQELKDVLAAQDFASSKREETIVIGIESSWVPKVQASAVQGLLNELTRKGFGSIRIVRASGEGLARELDEVIGKTNAPLKNVVILGASDIISSVAFEKFRSSGNSSGAFFAGVDLPEGFPESGYTRLLEMITLAVKMAFDESFAEDPYIETIQEGNRSYRFIPLAQAIELEELKKIYTLQQKLLTSA